MTSCDAIVVGAGPNGLVAANILASAGWEVVLIEAEDRPGGAVRSDEALGEGRVVDTCASFFPLAVASPAIASLGLERFGLTWRHAPVVLGHELDGEAVLLRRDPKASADALEADHPGDGEAWRRLSDRFGALGHDLMHALCTPFPPLRALGRIARREGPHALGELGRLVLMPLRRLVEEENLGRAAAALLAGCAAHADLGPDDAGSAFFAWLLASLGEHYGYPVPEQGAQRLSDALVARFEHAGGTLWCNDPVAGVRVVSGRALGVVTQGGRVLYARRAILADVPASSLFGGLVGFEHLPGSFVASLARMALDRPVVKLDFALEAPIPWQAPGLFDAATVHLKGDLDAVAVAHADLAAGALSGRPFVIVGQPGKADPSRCCSGEVVWAYTRAPRAATRHPEIVSGVVAALEATIERAAPGFRRLVAARRVLGPAELQAHDRSLLEGSINGGSAAPFQQLLLRPVPGLGRPETPIARLYLASSSAHPGGGVHGACGWNAARAALWAARTRTARPLAALCRLVAS